MSGSEEREGTQDGGSAGEERVISVGPAVILLPVVALATVAVGVWLGRSLGSSAEPTPVAPAVQSIQATAPAVPEVSDVAQTIKIIPQPAIIGDDVVHDLPVPNHPLLGQPAPDFTMTLLETGEDVSLSDYAGQPVLINFWATWCPPCRLEMPWLQNVYEDNADAGFVLLAVDAGERVPPSMVADTVSRFVQQMGLTFPVLMGDNAYQLQREYRVMGLPMSFLVDTDGIVADLHQGMYPNQVTLESRMTSIIPAEDG